MVSNRVCWLTISLKNWKETAINLIVTTPKCLVKIPKLRPNGKLKRRMIWLVTGWRNCKRIRLVFFSCVCTRSFQDKLAPIPTRREPPKPKEPPEFVRNVVGSSAAAGSAEFHIYRNNRRKEMNRIEHMEQEYQQKRLDEEYQQRVEERRRAEEEKLAKNRRKRQRLKERRKAKKRKVSSRIRLLQQSFQTNGDDSESVESGPEETDLTDKQIEQPKAVDETADLQSEQAD
ncbi:hypothetical protein M3Y98_01148700 [Aphelenchoides besseyi]|nr:hypothetical protein M3Y98_01148700 [Aphelenchoides besseyi]KAI6210762.1 hypothetical protein M3Y96_00362400 [Aphelenchoides besseyi]